MHPYEAILRMCAAAWPKPWYVRAYAQSEGIPQQQLYYYIENLWLDGLVQKAEGSAETGPGLTLTAAGRDVLEDPTALARLKEGRAVKPGDQGGAVREAIRRRTRPTATVWLIAANVAAFAYTAYLASRAGVLSDFITLSPFAGGNAQVAEVIAKAGGIDGGDWINGQWWRLLTSCFIHIGALHILANMYALYRVGGEIERWWGSVRYLVIYLFAGLGGSVLALGLEPRVVMAGASGALCGILGAAAVWVLCNGRHLPRSVAGQIRGNLIINAVLITFISLMPGVSWQGHLGGAVVGAAVALVMQVQRFGPSPWRWAVLGVLAVSPLLGWWFINYERRTNPAWQQVGAGGNAPGNGQADDQTEEDKKAAQEERKAFQDKFLDRIEAETEKAYKIFKDERSVLDLAPADRMPPAIVTKAKAHLAEQRDVIKQLADDLAAARVDKDSVAKNARQTGMRFTAALIDLLATAETRLREGTEWTKDDEAKVGQVKSAAADWYKLIKVK